MKLAVRSKANPWKESTYQTSSMSSSVYAVHDWLRSLTNGSLIIRSKIYWGVALVPWPACSLHGSRRPYNDVTRNNPWILKLLQFRKPWVSCHSSSDGLKYFGHTIPTDVDHEHWKQPLFQHQFWKSFVFNVSKICLDHKIELLQHWINISIYYIHKNTQVDDESLDEKWSTSSEPCNILSALLYRFLFHSAQ